jgi:hypothetical protein
LGFSLHANTRVGELNRSGLEKLCRYVCRPAVAAHRVEETADGKIRITLKNEWAGGVRAVVMSPRDLVLRLLAQIPLPRRALLRYHGCFAPASPLRAQVVAAGAKAPRRRKKDAGAAGTSGTSGEARVETPEATAQRMTWAVCLRRAFQFDALVLSRPRLLPSMYSGAAGLTVVGVGSLRRFRTRRRCSGSSRAVSYCRARCCIPPCIRAHRACRSVPEDIVAIRGPPEDLFPVEPAPQDDGDGWDRADGEWAA